MAHLNNPVRFRAIGQLEAKQWQIKDPNKYLYLYLNSGIAMFYIEINERGLQELRKDAWMNIDKYCEYMHFYRIYDFRLLSDFGYT